MAENNQPIEWYLARDGQQHGPVTDAELQKIIELGYLRPTDLVWRQGMADWATAETVLDLRPLAQPSRPAPPSPSPANQAGVASPADSTTSDAGRRSAQHGAAGRPQQTETTGSAQTPGYAPSGQNGGGHGSPAASPATRGPRSGDHQVSQIAGQPAARDAQPAPKRPLREAERGPGGEDDAPLKHRARGFPWRAATALVAVGILTAGGLALYKSGKLSDLPFLAAPVTSGGVPVVSRPAEAVRETTSASAASSSDAAHLPQPIEQRLQTSPLWKALQRNFPDWYAERVAEVAKLSSESKSQREIDAALTRAIVDLRRRHQSDALAASPERLKAMASSFVESLARLSRTSTSACYGYISQGESSPAIAELTSPEQRGAIDAQLTTIFDAIAEGRQSPAQRESPRREDYDVLSKELGQRGWSAADLQLFTDARALSRAAPEKVCQMVQDWFAAQLAVQDEAVKIRLLSEALKPVVAG